MTSIMTEEEVRMRCVEAVMRHAKEIDLKGVMDEAERLAEFVLRSKRTDYRMVEDIYRAIDAARKRI